MATIQRAYITLKGEYTRRLRRIEGQTRGLQRMVDDSHCIDIVTQVSVITSALQAVALGLLDEHLQYCIECPRTPYIIASPCSSAWRRSHRHRRPGGRLLVGIVDQRRQPGLYLHRDGILVNGLARQSTWLLSFAGGYYRLPDPARTQCRPYLFLRACMMSTVILLRATAAPLTTRLPSRRSVSKGAAQ